MLRMGVEGRRDGNEGKIGVERIEKENIGRDWIKTKRDI